MDEPDRSPASKDVTNLMRGSPNRSLMPVDRIKEAARVVLSEPNIAFPGLEYGPDEGYGPCREAIADWLTEFYQPNKSISSQRICITGGASQNLGCMLSVYTDPEYTRNVWIVAPAYFLAFRIFEDAGFAGRMRAVPEDETGIDLTFLRKAMRQSEEEAQSRGNTKPKYKPDRARAKVYKHVVYCVPNFSNPSSRTMTLDRRRELVRLAREFDALIVPDDVYDFLQWPAKTSTIQSDHHSTEMAAVETAHLPRLVDIDRELDGGTDRDDADGFGNACSNGTFSKLIGPGIRTGWVEGSEKFAYGVSQNGGQRSGGAPCQLTSTYVAHLLTTKEIQTHVHKVLRPAYASRYQTLMTAVEEHLFPLGFDAPQRDRNVVGGFFIWLSLPHTLLASQLAERCEQDENIIIAPGPLFSVPGDKSLEFNNSIRLCFAYEDEAKFSGAVKRIAHVAQALLSTINEVKNDEYVFVEKDKDDRSMEKFK